MNPAFWRGRRVFVTGYSGFKGSWLLMMLRSLGADVSGYSLPPETTPNLFTAANLSQSAGLVEGDVRDLPKLSSALTAAAPEVVMHLAAQALVRKSYAAPVETFGTNVMGTVNLLQAIRQTESVRAVVVVTSDKCYENKEWVWPYRENEPLGGHDPYSSSKACAELVTQAFARSYFSRGAAAIASARAGNVIGGGDWSEDRLIPDVMRALTQNRKVRIRNPGSIRPWQHVLDPLAGYLLLAEKLLSASREYGGAWNFGPNDTDGNTVGEVVAETCRLWGGDAGWERDATEQPHEALALRLDCAKAHHSLGWCPKLGLQDALAWTVDWYRSYYRAPQEAMSTTQQQLQRYLRD